MTSLPDAHDEIGSAADTVIDRVTITQQQAIEGVETAGAAVLAGLNRVQREMADFVAERVRQDMETQARLLRCRSLDEVRDLQMRFFRTAVDQYAAEAARLMAIGNGMLPGSGGRPER